MKSEPAQPKFFVLPGESTEVILLSDLIPGRGEQGTLLVLGRCMEPTLLPGDRLRLQKINGAVRLGWIVSFRWQEKILTHRVIRVRGNRFWARGDASLEMEGPVALNQALGKVTALHRGGRWQSLEGVRRDFFGFLLSQGLLLNRRIAVRFPGLRRAAESLLLDRLWFGKIVQQAGRMWIGDIHVQENADPRRIFGSWVSRRENREPKNLHGTEAQLRKSRLRLFGAYSGRGRYLGQAMLSWVPGEGNESVAVLGLSVRFGYRNLGVEEHLLATVEDVGRKLRLHRMWILVDPADARMQKKLQAMGFWPVAWEQRPKIPGCGEQSGPGAKLLLEKVMVLKPNRKKAPP